MADGTGAIGAGSGALDPSAFDTGRDPPLSKAEALNLVARAGSPDLVQAYAAAHPEDTAQLENALLRAGRFDQIHALAQAGLADPNAGGAKSVPEAKVKAFEAGNGAAMTRLNAQKAALTKESAALAKKEAHELKDPAKAAALRKQIDDRLGDVNQEIGLRAQVSDAIAASKAAPGKLGQDPAVAGPLARLAADKTLPSSHPFNSAAMDRKIAGVGDYDVAQWNRYGRTGGPAFPLRDDGKFSLAGSAALSDGVKSGALTASEAQILAAMSPNEGSLDAVQAYDNQTISAGAMQKTTNGAGTGELPKQIYDFSQSHPADYQRLFADKGWTVAHTGKGTGEGDYTLSFKDPADPNAKALTGRALHDYIKDRGQPDHWASTLGPMQQAGRDPAFQAQQVEDFRQRLDAATGVVPAGYGEPIRDYVSSEQGAALVLDQHVNRPGEVAGAFGRALDAFFAANPKADRDPAQWTPDQRKAFEPQIVKAYEAEREASTMTKPADRYGTIIQSPLSAEPGSYARTITP